LEIVLERENFIFLQRREKMAEEREIKTRRNAYSLDDFFIFFIDFICDFLSSMEIRYFFRV
jgi:hypothetical protein